MASQDGKTLLIVFSSGDLGDVGRHCVSLALKHRRVKRVDVITDQPPQHLFDEKFYKKCSCPPHSHDLLPYRDRLRILPVDISRDDLLPQIQGVDAVISCLGNRLPFHSESGKHIAEYGTTQLVRALLNLDRSRQRIIMLSSVGIGNDWPPLEGLREGSFLAGLFRTICWEQYHDLSEAERTVHRRWTSNQLDYVTARCVLLPDDCRPTGRYHTVELPQDNNQLDGAALVGRQVGVDFHQSISKLDAALFLIGEAVYPSLHQKVVILGGVPHCLVESMAAGTNDADRKSAAVS